MEEMGAIQDRLAISPLLWTVVKTFTMQTVPPLPYSTQPPAAPKVFGILNIVFGTIGIITSLFSFRIYYGSLENQVGLVADLARSDAFYLTSMRVIMIPGFIFVLLELASGIGLLKTREWARKIAISCAIYSILAGLFTAWLTFTHVLPFTFSHVLPTSTDPAVASITRAISTISTVIGLIVGLLYPILTLVFLTRPRLRAHFAATSAAPDPVGRPSL